MKKDTTTQVVFLDEAMKVRYRSISGCSFLQILHRQSGSIAHKDFISRLRTNPVRFSGYPLLDFWRGTSETVLKVFHYYQS